MSWLDKTHVGDCREILPRMASDGVRVQTCVTSPPYYGLRDYGTASWDGGDVECDHQRTLGGTKSSTLNNYDNGLSEETIADKVLHYGRASYRDTCGKCGARRVDQQLGLEQTPDEYVDQLVQVFRAVRDLLADDGTLWLNLGDSYANDGKWGGASGGKHVDALHGNTGIGRSRKFTGLKPKDLIGIPWRVAFALRDDGWYLRSDIVWAKPNPMPESVADRPTKAHEYLFLLAKSEHYFYDAASMQEPCESGPSDVRKMQESRERIGGKHKTLDDSFNKASAATNIGRKRSVGSPTGRNRRTVWTIATTPFTGAHFATFPRKLIEPCIVAGSRPGDVVLDPFAGSGTTRRVAIDLGRHYVGCELNAAYAELDRERPTTMGLPL